MEPENRETEPSVESEFATTVKYLELYMRQKADLCLQQYVFEPLTFLGSKLMLLAIIIALLTAGTFILVAGVILLIATWLPLWAALLLAGAIAFIVAAIIAYGFFYKPIILQTPTATEMMNRGKT